MGHLGRLGGDLTKEGWILRGFPGGRRAGPIPHWEFLRKEPNHPDGWHAVRPCGMPQGAADPVVFGPSRHRARLVGQRPLRCLAGSLWEVFRGPLRPLGGLLEASWGFLGVSWGQLGGILEALLPPGGLLAVSGVIMAHEGSWDNLCSRPGADFSRKSSAKRPFLASANVTRAAPSVTRAALETPVTPGAGPLQEHHDCQHREFEGS